MKVGRVRLEPEGAQNASQKGSEGYKASVPAGVTDEE